ncbi:phage virion morphogenesis protein [Burkholderia pseudomallei]|uniref:phage virion morphogenesis protein n=1 Tax=Burkholderia pseudomallei TaxID=28450 RepID=UPI000A1A19E8|nr:phage virion morphogenesis protein [Burkholderia pseudomallei]ARK88532.1 phage virion morphogenesis protein [Burkholderia pseudomallei]
MTDDLQALEKWAGALLAKLSPAARSQLLRELGRDLRRAQQSRVAAQHNPDGSTYEPRKVKRGGKRLRDKAGRVKREAMFRKLRTARFLRIDVDNTGLAIGFDERLSRIARVHQEGQKAPVEPGGPLAQYPVRVLLGFATEDRTLLRDRLSRYLNRK